MRYQNLPKEMGLNNMHPEYLTQRQEYIWGEMLDFQLVHQRPPTRREIRDAIGVVSTRSVSAQLKALIRKGFAEQGEKGASRTIVAVDPMYVPTVKGRRACG